MMSIKQQRRAVCRAYQRYTRFNRKATQLSATYTRKDKRGNRYLPDAYYLDPQRIVLLERQYYTYALYQRRRRLLEQRLGTTQREALGLGPHHPHRS